jgi:hypothetical protein
LEPGSDQLLGVDTDGSDGWSLALSTAGLPDGYNVFMAQANTADGAVNWATAVVQIAAAGSDAGSPADSSGNSDGGESLPRDAFTAEMNSSQSMGFVVDAGSDETIDLYGTLRRAVWLYNETEDIVTPWLQAEVDWGDAGDYVIPAQIPYTHGSDGGWVVGLDHQYSDFGQYTVTVTVHSLVNGTTYCTTSGSFVVSVVDQPVAVTLAQETAEIYQYTSVNTTGYFKAFRSSDFSVLVDSGDGSPAEWVPYYWNEFNNRWEFDIGSHTYWSYGNGNYTITVTVQDGLGNSASAQIAVDVQWALEAGECFTTFRTFEDPRDLYHRTPSWTGTVDYGDGSGEEGDPPETVPYYGTFWADGRVDWTYYLSHRYGDPGGYTVHVSFSDGFGGNFVYDQFDVTVVPHVGDDDGSAEEVRWVSAGGAYYVAANGGEYTDFQASATGDWTLDGGSDTPYLYLAWDLHGDGGYGNDPGERSYLYDLYADGIFGNDSQERGPVSFLPTWATGWQSIGVVAYDVEGHRAWAATSMDVEDSQPPQDLEVTLTSSEINEGGSTTLSGSFTDVSQSDPHTALIDWGDGDLETRLVGPSDRVFAVTHQYHSPMDAVESPYEIRVLVIDSFGGSTGWVTTQITVHNVAPTVASPPIVHSSPVTTTATRLTVLGDDAAGEANLTYTWTATAWPEDADPPSFDTYNGTNLGRDIVVRFSAPGEYTFSVTITDPFGGWTTVGGLPVQVQRALTTISLTPDPEAEHGTTVYPGESLWLEIAGADQFGDDFTPENVVWSVAGMGAIDQQSGTYTAPAPTDTDHLTHAVKVSAQAGSAAASLDLAVAGRHLGYRVTNSTLLFDTTYDPDLINFTSNLTISAGWHETDQTAASWQIWTQLITGSVSFSYYDSYHNQIDSTLDFPNGANNGYFVVDDYSSFDPATGGDIEIQVWGENLEATCEVSIDAEPFVRIENAAPVDQGETAVFTLYASAPVSDDLYVRYHTVDGTAIADTATQQNDYVGVTDGLAVIYAGEVKTTIAIQTHWHPEDRDLSDKEFTLVLDSAAFSSQLQQNGTDPAANQFAGADSAPVQPGQGTGTAQLRDFVEWEIVGAFSGNPWDFDSYRGTCKAGSPQSKLSDLAEFITGHAVDAESIRAANGDPIEQKDVGPGTVVDIGGLKSQMQQFASRFGRERPMLAVLA